MHVNVYLKDTLKWRVPDIVSWHGGGVEAHRAWELAHQLVLKVLSAFVLFATVDKHLVLKHREGIGVNSDIEMIKPLFIME